MQCRGWSSQSRKVCICETSSCPNGAKQTTIQCTTLKRHWNLDCTENLLNNNTEEICEAVEKPTQPLPPHGGACRSTYQCSPKYMCFGGGKGTIWEDRQDDQNTSLQSCCHVVNKNYWRLLECNNSTSVCQPVHLEVCLPANHLCYWFLLVKQQHGSEFNGLLICLF